MAFGPIVTAGWPLPTSDRRRGQASTQESADHGAAGGQETLQWLGHLEDEICEDRGAKAAEQGPKGRCELPADVT